MIRMIKNKVLLILLAFGSLGILFAGCEKFADPGLDQETYAPDSTNIHAERTRRILFVGVDGLPSDAVQSIAPQTITGMLANSKYSWEVMPGVILGDKQTDITAQGTLTVMRETIPAYINTYGSNKLVDNNISTKYYAEQFGVVGTGLWYQLSFPNPISAESYSMTSANDLPARDPKDWQFLGSNDAVSWDTLDVRTNQVFATRLLTVNYYFENHKAYKYYRNFISAINSGTLFQQAEWRLIQNEYLSGINAASWASMMTGNTRTIHRIWDSTFYAKPVDTTNSIPVSPNLSALRLLQDYDDRIKTVAISSWGNLVTTLLSDASKKVTTTSDEDTKTQAVSLLKTDPSSVFITQFGDVINARKQYGSANNTPEFLAAVNKTDGYIKEMADAIKSRPNYAKEEWIIIIASTQGGTGAGSPVDLYPGFVMIYNPLFKPQDLTKMNPAINVKQEDIARQILYWMRVPATAAIQTGSLWLDRFGAEFIK